MDIRDAILNSAEQRVRKSGFHGCSYRQIATDVGIKGASVHYHFPRKEELGVALVNRYEARVLQNFGDSKDDRDLATKLDTLRSVFRTALTENDGMCLCGLLATEMHSLPPPVADATRRFFVTCNNWLTEAFSHARVPKAAEEASYVTALLQGAMMQSIALSDVSAFDTALKRLIVPTPKAKRKPASSGNHDA